MDILKILFILSLFSFSFGEIIRIPFFSAQVKLLDITVAVLFLAWIVVSIIKKRISKIIFLPILMFSFIGGLSLLLNFRFLNPSEFLISFSYLVRWVGYASIFSIVSSFDKKFKSKIEIFLFFLGLITVILGYIQYLFYSNLKNLYYLGWDDHLYRMFSIFLDPNFAGAFFVLYFLFLFNLTFENYKNKKLQLVYGFFAALTLISVFLTYSRSAFVMLVICVCIFLILKKKIMYIAIVILTLTLITFVLPKAYKTEGTNFLRTASSEARIGSFYQTMNVFERNPVLGVGFNAYRYAKNRYGFTFGNWQESHSDATADNSFAFVLATTGIIGFSFFIFMWYRILALRRNSALIISSVVALFINSLFINSLFYVFFLFWIWIILGVKENK